MPEFPTDLGALVYNQCGLMASEWNHGQAYKLSGTDNNRVPYRAFVHRRPIYAKCLGHVQRIILEPRKFRPAYVVPSPLSSFKKR